MEVAERRRRRRRCGGVAAGARASVARARSRRHVRRRRGRALDVQLTCVLARHDVRESRRQHAGCAQQAQQKLVQDARDDDRRTADDERVRQIADQLRRRTDVLQEVADERMKMTDVLARCDQSTTYNAHSPTVADLGAKAGVHLPSVLCPSLPLTRSPVPIPSPPGLFSLPTPFFYFLFFPFP